MMKLDIFLHRWKRYIIYGAHYALLEKPKGIDFTSTDLSLLKKSNGKMHGYSKTSEKHLREIFNYLGDVNNCAFLDIGCGKGAVLKSANEHRFAKVTGIDIQQDLIDRAKKNFNILKLSDSIECICVDARYFSRYGDYDIFFFFNPFSEIIMREVIDGIVQSRLGKKPTMIVYHNPIYHNVIEDTAEFICECTLYEPLKRYNTNIYRMISANDAGR